MKSTFESFLDKRIKLEKAVDLIMLGIITIILGIVTYGFLYFYFL